MHITSTFARKSPCHLLRESYWQDGKVKKRTLANLSPLSQHAIDVLRLALANRLLYKTTLFEHETALFSQIQLTSKRLEIRTI